MEEKFQKLSLDDQRSERTLPTTAPTADHATKPSLPPNCFSALQDSGERLEQCERREKARMSELTDAREIAIAATSFPPLYPLKSSIFTR